MRTSRAYREAVTSLANRIDRRELERVDCVQCGREFVALARKRKRMYCSQRCNNAAWIARTAAREGGDPQ